MPAPAPTPYRDLKHMSRSLSTDVQELTRGVKDLSDNIIPALAVLTEQVKELKLTARDKASTSELHTVRDSFELRITQMIASHSATVGAHDDMLDSHEARLKDIEISNAQTKEILINMKATLDKIEKSVAWMRDKIFWFLGGGTVVMAGWEFIIHKK